jgi:hypothetical protein
VFRSVSRAATLLLISASLSAGGASAASEPTHDGIVSGDPANFTPNVEDGHVRQMVQVGGRIIAVGKFTTVSHAGQTLTRRNIFAFDASTGAIDTNFTPTVGSEIYDIVDGGNGTVIIGGAFPSVTERRVRRKSLDSMRARVKSSLTSNRRNPRSTRG